MESSRHVRKIVVWLARAEFLNPRITLQWQFCIAGFEAYIRFVRRPTYSDNSYHLGVTLETLPVHLFKDSFGPFLALLNEHQVKYQMSESRYGVPMASSGVIEIVHAVGGAAMWGALAAVLVAFINSRRGRKVIITTKDNTVVHAEGLSPKELEKVLEQAKNLTAIDPINNQSEESSA